MSCVGTACMNYFNVGRAMRGLIIYVKKHVEATDPGRKPRLVIGHDTRHFSRDFAEFCAKIGTDLGCDIYLFDSPRATPEVSFAIRELNADSGVVLTASHNPSHDNGFKAYFNDGAQLVPPHDKAVIEEVNSLTSEEYEPLPEDRRGTLHVLDASFDRVYMDRLKTGTAPSGALQQGRRQNRLLQPPRHGRPYHRSPAEGTGLQRADRGGAGRAGRPLPDGGLPQPGKPAGPGPGH